jgi:hypothetical protein
MTTAVAVPAPVGGWNARDSYDDMDAADAVTMVNMIPRSGYVESRKGSTLYVDLGRTLLPMGILTLIPYQNLNLLATYSDTIWDITDPALPVQLTHPGFSGDPFQYSAFQDLVIMTNGTDVAVTFDGTVLTDLVTTGHPGTWWGCNTFKGRMYYWDKEARSFWYSQAGGYQGVMTEFDLSTQLRTGGTLTMMLTYTLDAGDGVDDLAVFVFSTGETLVYQGDDPENFLRWQSNGRFQIGEPLGIRAHQKVGGTEIILTKDGYVDLAEALKTGRYSEESVYSNKIIRAAKQAALQYGSLFGWECLLYPAGNLFIVNVPRSAFKNANAENSLWAIESEQHVRNTSTGSWCRFTGWSATTFGVWKDKLYFAAGGSVYLADVGSSDSGTNISTECIPAFNYLGQRGRRKYVTACAHVTNYQQPEFLIKDGMSDFNIQFVNNVPLNAYQGAAKWNVSKWNTSKWVIGPNQLQNTTEGWQNVSAMGYAVTIALRVNVLGTPFIWYGTNYIYKNIGAI